MALFAISFDAPSTEKVGLDVGTSKAYTSINLKFKI